MYGSEAQYNDQKNDWYGIAGSQEVARIKQDKLAFKKLQNQPIQALSVNGVTEGYKGLVANLSENRRYNFVINGPEDIRLYLGPGERKELYLIPGEYVCAVYRGGSITGKPWHFKVGTQQHVFMNEKYHWYVLTEW
jgi:hypothetical protein